MRRIVTSLALAAVVATTAVSGAAPAMAASSGPPGPPPATSYYLSWATPSRRESSPMPLEPASRPIRDTPTSSTRRSASVTRACS